jgi:hypothetical protein
VTPDFGKSSSIPSYLPTLGWPIRDKLSDLCQYVYMFRHFNMGIYWIGDCVGPLAGLDLVAKRKIPAPIEIFTPVV